MPPIAVAVHDDRDVHRQPIELISRASDSSDARAESTPGSSRDTVQPQNSLVLVVLVAFVPGHTKCDVGPIVAGARRHKRAAE